MCTAATYKTNDFYFGRTLDYESSYGEEIVIMPRNFPLNFVNMGRIATHINKVKGKVSWHSSCCSGLSSFL